jgi:hypothetical protein
MREEDYLPVDFVMPHSPALTMGRKSERLEMLDVHSRSNKSFWLDFPLEHSTIIDLLHIRNKDDTGTGISYAVSGPT